MKIKNALLIIPIFFFASKTYADEAYVYCSSINHKWKWLKYETKSEDIVFGAWGGNTMNKGTVIVSGKWNFFILDNKYFTYFILEDAEKKYNELKALCKRQHGSDYIYPQPVQEVLDGNWSAFAKADNTLLPGYVTSKIFRSPVSIPHFLMNQ